jgi:two-component system, LuxR family, response regulator FixJ
MSVEPSKATVFVVDDDAAVRDSLQRMLGSGNWLVETYASAEAFLTTHDRSRVGCLVLDVRMPGMNGPELQKRLRAEGADLPIIFLTAYGDVPTAVQALKDGAFEFIEKPLRADVLRETITKAIELDVQRRQRERARQDLMRRTAELSRREREVCELLVRGKSVKDIAQALGVDPKTVHTHRARVLEKFAVESNAELVVLFASTREAVEGTQPLTRPAR